MKSADKLVCGWGINDAGYEVYIYDKSTRPSKVVWMCPYYTKWKSMLSRCLSSVQIDHRPTYNKCLICEEWKYLSNFIKWVDEQPNKDWQNCQPDKDLLGNEEKVYTPDTTVFVDQKVNTFIINCGRSRGNYMVGVSFEKSANRFRADCSCYNKTQSRFLGRFNTELEAHKAWQAKKHEYACQLAELQDDPRVADALRQRYAPDKDWTNL